MNIEKYRKEQLVEYAKDIASLYQAEKEKKKELESAYQQLLKYADELNTTIANLKNSQQDLQGSYLDTIHRLAIVAEFRDETTGNHIVRISRYSALLAEKAGLPEKAVQNILYTAPMHDVGKVGIPDSILLKPAKLTPGEFEIIKTHTTIGARILANSKARILNIAQRIALYHHEKWNGKGYPYGLAGNKIPLFARIVALADVFDALVSPRPYKGPYSIEVACDIIKKERGEHFDPGLADIFLNNIDGIIKACNPQEVNNGQAHKSL